MSDAHHLDPAQARSDFERCVIAYRNDQRSWRSIAERLRCSQRICRDAWARANAHQRGGKVAAGPEREDPTMGNKKHARGVPILAEGVSGAIHGTRPDTAYTDHQRREHERRPFRRSAA